MSAVKHLLAVASVDGETVHQHFGRADSFRIVALDDEEGYTFLETRNVVSACHDFHHGEHSFEAVWEVISDCEAVLVGKIGSGASAFLIGKGMRVFESIGYLDEILIHIIQERLLDRENDK